MTVYLVVELAYSDESWRAEYGRMVPPMLAKVGGRYLARGRPEVLEADGCVPDTLALLDFPSADALKDFLASAEYRPFAERRRQGAQTQMYMLEALEPPA